jgi:uncharacterized membrane protein YoaK (UPF0700 family)
MPLQTLPAWIQVSAFFLALNAGMINILAICNVAHQAISHMTGNMSYLVIDLLQQDWSKVFFVLAVLFFFVIGAFYSGFIIRDSKLKFGRRYGWVLTLEALFLTMTWIFISSHPYYALMWAAAACGMQNALASTYNGTIIRTTHLSGVLTDLGLAIGYKARGLYVDPKRILLHSLIVIGFFAGSIIGGLAFYFDPKNSFLFPALMTSLLAFVYWFFYYKNAYSFKN